MVDNLQVTGEPNAAVVELIEELTAEKGKLTRLWSDLLVRYDSLSAENERLREALRPFVNALRPVEVLGEFASDTIIEFSPVLDRWPYEDAVTAIKDGRENA